MEKIYIIKVKKIWYKKKIIGLIVLIIEIYFDLFINLIP